MATERIRKLATALVIALLFGLAALSVVRTIQNTLGRTGSGSSIDFHSYWDPGHAILRGIDPYTAPLRGELNTAALGLPGAEGGEAFVSIASNTPLQLLLLSPLSLLDWPSARLVWMLINFALAGGILWAAGKLFPHPYTLAEKTIIGLTFLAMIPTRNAISNGQPILLIMLAVLLAGVVAPRKPWLAGLLFGVALSKYSLVLPAALWFLIFGYYGALAIAAGVQVGGVLLLALITSTSPLVLVGQYLQVALGHVGGDGELDIASFFMRLDLPVAAARVLSVIGVAVTLYVVGRWAHRLWQRSGWPVQAGPLGRPLLLVALLIASLPFIYHHLYDAILVILLVFAAFAIRHADAPGLRRSPQFPFLSAVDLIVGAVVAVLLLPYFAVARFVPAWDALYPLLTAITTLVAWGVSLWVLWHAGKPEEAEAASG